MSGCSSSARLVGREQPRDRREHAAEQHERARDHEPAELAAPARAASRIAACQSMLGRVRAGPHRADQRRREIDELLGIVGRQSRARRARRPPPASCCRRSRATSRAYAARSSFDSTSMQPKSSSASLPSSVTRKLPGCGSAWTCPRTSICAATSPTSSPSNRSRASGVGAFSSHGRQSLAGDPRHRRARASSTRLGIGRGTRGAVVRAQRRGLGS